MSAYTPQRVVSLQPSATVIMERLGMLDRVVACTRYCLDVCPQAEHVGVVVADSWSAQASEIMEARPDLVIAAVPYQTEAVTEILKAGARFLGLAPKTLADIYGDIAAIAGVMDAGEQGDAVIQQMQHEIGRVRNEAAGLPVRRVYCEEWGKPLIHSQPWVAELIEAAGGEFVGRPGAQTTAEQVAARDPEVIVAAWCGAGDRVPIEKLVEQRRWSQLRAVRNGQVYCIRDEFLNTPSPTLLHGLLALAAAIHPERFSAIGGLRRIEAGAKAPSFWQAPVGTPEGVP